MRMTHKFVDNYSILIIILERKPKTNENDFNRES